MKYSTLTNYCVRPRCRQLRARARAPKLVRLSTSWMRPPPVFFSLDVSEDVHLRVKGSAARGISGCSRLSELVTPSAWLVDAHQRLQRARRGVESFNRDDWQDLRRRAARDLARQTVRAGCRRAGLETRRRRRGAHKNRERSEEEDHACTKHGSAERRRPRALRRHLVTTAGVR